MNLAAGLADVSLLQLGLVAAMAMFASVVGGVAGYGTGILMPLVLVPIAGAEAVVPIISITALFNNSSRALAFRHGIDWMRAGIIIVPAIPTCILGAYAFTLLSGRGALVVIGSTLICLVPLRRVLLQRGVVLSMRGLAVGGVFYGVLTGGTSGAGVVLLSMLMASGLAGTSVIATDAVISIVLSVVKVAVFGIAGAIDARVVAFALLIGLIATPGAFIAKVLVERMPVRLHTAMLDAVVIVGGLYMVTAALLR